MSDSGIDRRKHKRVFFTPVDQLEFLVDMPENPYDPISAILLNISIGGLGFVSTRSPSNQIKKESIIKVKEIRLPDSGEVIKDVEMIVRYIMDIINYDHITYGCEFEKISEADRNKIQVFVDDRFKSI